MKKFFFLIILLSVNLVYAQFVWNDRVYSPLIKTVGLYSNHEHLYLPIMYVNESEGLWLSFDEMSEETHRFEYTFIHCNSDWTESSLEYTDYIEGFETALVENFANSFNTIQRYVHYEQSLPNETTRLTKSGNYILKVYKEGEPDQVVFTKRFYCLDKKADVSASVIQSREPSLRNTHQEVDVKVYSTSGLSFDSPSSRIKLAIQQNGREDNKRFVPIKEDRGVELLFSFKNENIFEGGNVFRVFDFTSLRQRSNFVSNIDYIGGENIVRLREEELKGRSPFVSQTDLKGAYYIRNEVDENYALCSDYAWVYFYLPAPLNLEGNYYVVGDLTDWRFSEQNKFVFDASLNQYVLRIFLKQGYYNYQILFLPNGYTKASYREIEGNHSETQNRYNVFLYYREPGNDYDSFIGYGSTEYMY
jgi:hypothetical protein